MEKYCYRIPYHARVEGAIRHALASQSFEDLGLSLRDFESWIDGKNLLPISVLNKACEINKKDPFIPVKYQFTWFCLHNIRIYRKQPGGRVIKPVVKFTPVYVEKKKDLLDCLQKAIEVCGSKDKFAELVGCVRKTVNHWLNTKCTKKPPITAFIKAAQFLNKNLWEILDNVKLYSINSNDFIVFRKEYPKEIDELLIWIEGDGNICINHGNSIRIRQKKDGLSALYVISQKFKEVFGVAEKNMSIKEEGKKDMFMLHIYSKPLSQILVLRYNIFPGYKVYSIPPPNLFSYKNREEAIRKLSRHLETEGTFSYVRKTCDPRIGVGTKSKIKAKLFFKMFNSLGYHFHLHDEFRKGRRMYVVKLYRNKEVIKLCKEVLPYLWHKRKIEDAKRLITALTHD